MRCKDHRNDQSSTVGVCATCLRERLSAAIAAQTQARLGSNSSGFQATWHQSGVGPASGAELKMNRNGGRMSSLLSGQLRSRVGSMDPGPAQQHGCFADSSPSRFPGVISSGFRETSHASFPRAKGSPSAGGLERRMAERGVGRACPWWGCAGVLFLGAARPGTATPGEVDDVVLQERIKEVS